jgi:hypothetical protein
VKNDQNVAQTTKFIITFTLEKSSPKITIQMNLKQTNCEKMPKG